METEAVLALGWQHTPKGFVKRFYFLDFKEALSFINRVGDFSEAHQHHPEIINNYNLVTLRLWTHDTDSLTEKDVHWVLAFEKQDQH